MYELLVLSLLMDYPLHAYLIAEVVNRTIGPWETISRGTLSSLLTKLERGGMIEPADPASVPFVTKRPSRALAITDAGRARFRALMLDTTSNPGTYQRLFHIKSLHLSLLSPDEQRYLVDHYLTYCETGFRYLEMNAEDMRMNPMKRAHMPPAMRGAVLELMALSARQWREETAWARQLRAQIATPEMGTEEER